MDATIIVRIRKRWAFKQKQGFTFDMFMWCYMSSYTQLPLNDFGELGDRFIDVMYYCAAYSYNRNMGRQAKFTEADVKKWFDNMPQKTANAIMTTMLKSKVGGESMEDLVQSYTDSQKKKITVDSVYDYAIGELGLKRSEFECMTWGDYMRTCLGYKNKELSEARRLRLLVASHVGKDPRKLWDLPGDYLATHLDTPEMREKILHRFKVFKKWNC